MKKQLLALVFLSFMFMNSYSQNWKWANGISNTNNYNTSSITTDSQGNSYVTGYFSGTSTWGGQSLTAAGSLDGYIVKYDNNGVLVWVKQIRSGVPYGESVEPKSIALDTEGNIYICGTFHTIVSFSPSINLVNTPGNKGLDAFIAKYNNNGVCLWAQQAGDVPPIQNQPNSVIASSIAVDAKGNSYITGHYFEAANFGAIQFISTGESLNVFIAKYDPSGKVLWAKKEGGYDVDEGKGIAINAKGGCFVTGHFSYKADFSGHTLLSSNSIGVSSGMFVASYNENGTIQWVKQSIDKPNSFCSGLAITSDIDGNCYVTGDFYGTESFGPYTLIVPPLVGPNVWITKYDPSGNELWANKEGSINAGTNSNIKAITLNSADKAVYIAGNYSNAITFSDGTNLVGNNNNGNLFIVGYDLTGKIQLKKQIITSDAGIIYGIASNHAGVTPCFYVAGDYFKTNSIFFEDALNSPSGITLNIGFSGFVAKYYNAAEKGYIKSSSAFRVSNVSSETKQTGTQIFPNPAQGQFTASTRLAQKDLVDISIYNVVGRRVSQHQAVADAGNYTQTIDISQLPAGMYVVKINGGGNNAIQKLIISEK